VHGVCARCVCTVCVHGVCVCGVTMWCKMRVYVCTCVRERERVLVCNYLCDVCDRKACGVVDVVYGVCVCVCV